MEVQSIPCVRLADLFAGVESLIAKFERPLWYEVIYMAGHKFVTIEDVVSFAEDEPENEMYQLILERAQQYPLALVQF